MANYTEREAVRLFSRIFATTPPSGIGDDAALVSAGDGLIVSSDIMTERNNFNLSPSSYERGWMAAAANISDIAAMGGSPRALITNFLLPPKTEMRELRAMARGIRDCAIEYGAKVIGGDTKRGKELALSITVLGAPGRHILWRSGARKGDLIAVTGELGRAAYDYERLRAGERIRRSFLTFPRPRVKEGIILSSSGAATAATDITDGLALSAWNISRASGVRVEISAKSIPIFEALRALTGRSAAMEKVLYWGGDYELLFSVKEDMAMKLAKRLIFTIIGRADQGRGVYMVDEGRRTRLAERGFDSFEKRWKG